MRYALAFLALTACAPTPRQIVKPQIVEVSHGVRVPIPPEYVAPIVIPHPAPACGALWCNSQVAELVDDLYDIADTCNARFEALRKLDADKPP